ncbi:MAG: MFS transporter [Salinigranum sp.]
MYLVAAGRFLDQFGSGLVYPFATVYFYLVVGVPLSVVGVGLLANNVTKAAGTALGGYLADRYGRKPVMVASMGLSTFTLAAYALVRTGPEFVVAAAAAGFTLGLYAPAGGAYVAELVDGSDRDRAFSLLKVARNAGFGSGFVAGGLLYAVQHVAVFLVDGATTGAFALLLVVALPRVHRGRRDVALRESVGDWRRAITRPRIVGLAALNLLFAVLYVQMQATVPVIATGELGLSSAQLGTLYVLNPLVVVLFQLPLADYATRWRRTRTLVVSAGFWGVSYVAVLLAADAGPGVLLGVGLVGAFLVLRTVGEILHSPFVTALGSALAPRAERGSQLSLLEVAMRVGQGLGAFVGGLFFDAGAQRFLWPALVVVAAALAVGLLALEPAITPAENGVGGGADDGGDGGGESSA